jgi:hypothetical protein
MIEQYRLRNSTCFILFFKYNECGVEDIEVQNIHIGTYQFYEMEFVPTPFFPAVSWQKSSIHCPHPNTFGNKERICKKERD